MIKIRTRNTPRDEELALRKLLFKKLASKIGTMVAVALKGRCPACGGSIDLSSEYVIHKCPALPRVSGKIECYLEDDKVVIVASSAEVGCRLANILSHDHDLNPVLIVPI